ncbi:membrane protein [Clostridiales bacterium PH28_bin88]|nr:membrane protein [Clostridiales bacterium PH28_bin88]
MKNSLLIFFLLAVAVATIASPFASSFPDGLERVAEDLGFLSRSEGYELVASPMPDYSIPGIENEILSTAISGLVGVIITVAAVWGLGRLASNKGNSNIKRLHHS